MKLLPVVFFVLFIPSLVLGQSSAPSPSPDPSTKIADQIKSLQDAIAQQQKQIEMLQQQLAEQKDAQAKVVNATYTTPAASATVGSDMQVEAVKESPLSFRIGGAEFTPGGFVDFENVFRSTNTTNVAATSFGAIPFSNDPTGRGHLTEYRSTGQYSRLSLRIDGTFKENKVRAYIEGDLNGNDAGNVFVGTNPHTARLRLYWLDLRRGKWEFLGGQSWGLLTPNRTGLSPMPSDLALGLGEDSNVHVGINHTRAGSFRATWHPNDNFAWAVGIENPQQFVGNEVVFPSAFTTPLNAQFDNNTGGGTAGIPNMAPDFNTKMAWDSDLAGRHFHGELGGMMTTVKTTVTPVGGTTFSSHSKVGGGVQAALNYEFIKNFRFIANGLYGNGLGRYMIGLAPQAVVRPVATATGFDAQPSLVHAGTGTIGFELQPNPKSQFGLYYGALYAQRNFFPDLTAGGAGPCAGKPCIGFGGIPNSAASATTAAASNRAVQQGTIDWTQTFWRNPQYGAVLLVTQVSYVTRAPWFVSKDPVSGALLQPKNAHLTMGYLSVRYVLP